MEPPSLPETGIPPAQARKRLSSCYAKFNSLLRFKWKRSSCHSHFSFQLLSPKTLLTSLRGRGDLSGGDTCQGQPGQALVFCMKELPAARAEGHEARHTLSLSHPFTNYIPGQGEKAVQKHQFSRLCVCTLGGSKHQNQMA